MQKAAAKVTCAVTHGSFTDQEMEERVDTYQNFVSHEFQGEEEFGLRKEDECHTSMEIKTFVNIVDDGNKLLGSVNSKETSQSAEWEGKHIYILKNSTQDKEQLTVHKKVNRTYILWLQCDFGIYVCDLFDTGRASRVLKLGRNNLEFLLQHYGGITVDKKYQTAEWRLRPLPPEMIIYAREGTHCHLYVHDLMQKNSAIHSC